MKREVCPGPHKRLQPQHRPPSASASGSVRVHSLGDIVLHFTQVCGEKVYPPCLGVKSKKCVGGVPSAVLMLHLTWGCISPGQPGEPPILIQPHPCFLPGEASGSGPHFLFSQLNVISSRAFQSHHRPTTPNFLLFSGFDVLFRLYWHMLRVCLAPC